MLNSRFKWGRICFAAALLSFFQFFQLEAACPATHLYLGELYLVHHPSTNEYDRREFLLGTLFPDIRYTGAALREETHVLGVTLNEIDNTMDPFTRGVLFHSYVDEKREEFVLSRGIYDHLSSTVNRKQIHTFVKLLEDEFVWDQIVDSNLWVMLFYLSEGEKQTGFDLRTLEGWHKWLGRYFTYRPSEWIESMKMIPIGMPSWLEDWESAYPNALSDPFIEHYIQDLILHFETLLNE